MAHATSQDYTDYTGATAPPRIDLMLARASRDVDRALLAAVYDADDEAVLTALREATIEQVAAWVASGTGEEGTGVTPVYSNVSIGSVTLARPASAVSSVPGIASERRPRLCVQANLRLSQAGLLGHAPTTYPVCP